MNAPLRIPAAPIDVMKIVPVTRKSYGMGIHSRPEEYSGPSSFILQEHKAGRKFEVTRVPRNPSGAAGGSFRVDELVPDRALGERRVFCGFNYSYPDYRDCLRVAREHSTT